MNYGYVKLDRRLLNNEIWKERPFDRGRAWVDLILKVNHADATYLLGNQNIAIKRGQILTSVTKLSECWGWSRQRANGFLSALERQGMITKESTTKYTMITLVNYAKYQGEGTTKSTTNDTTNGTANKTTNGTTNEQQMNTNNNDTSNNYNNDCNNKIPCPDDFNKFWEAYPKKVARKKCLAWWKSNKPDSELLAKMLDAINYWASSEKWNKEQGQFIPNPYTWLNQARWEDGRLENETPPKYDDKELSDYYV